MIPCEIVEVAAADEAQEPKRTRISMHMPFYFSRW